MKKLFPIGLLFVLMCSQVVFAEEEFNFEDFNLDTNDGTAQNLMGGGLGLLLGLVLGMGIIFLIIPIILSIVSYVYLSLALQTIAKKTDTDKAWLAWIPLFSCILCAKVAKIPLWTVWAVIIGIILGSLISILSQTIGGIVLFATIIFTIVVGIMWWVKIAQKRGRSGWFILIALIPFIGIYLLYGILAWSKGGKTPEETPSKSTKPQDKKPSSQQDSISTLQNQEKLDKMVGYIKENTTQGYDINSIKNSLLQQGFDSDLIEKALQKTQNS